MKKLLFSMMALLLLVGCASKEASTSANEVLFTIGKNKVTQNDIFSTMKATDSGTLAIKEGQYILTKDIKDEDIQAEVDTMIKKQKDDLKDEFLTEIKKLGFDTEEDYVENNLKPYVRIRHLLKVTMTEEYERLGQELVPRKIAVLEMKTEENAKKAKDMLDNGATLENIAASLDEEVTYKGTETIEFLQSSKLPNAVTTFLKETNEPATSDIITVGESTKQYFIASLVDADISTYKDEVIEAALESNEISQRELARLYKVNGFKVYDQGIYNAIKKSNSEYLAN